MFPLSSVLLPNEPLPLHVFESRYRSLLADCMAGGRAFGVVLIAEGSEVGGGESRHDVGTAAHIESVLAYADGRQAVLARGRNRIRVLQWLPDSPYPLAVVDDAPSGGRPLPAGRLREVAGAVRRVRALLSEMGGMAPLPPELDLEGDDEAVSWLLCSLAPVDVLVRQHLLEIDDVGQRLETLAELADELTKELSRMLTEGDR